MSKSESAQRRPAAALIARSTGAPLSSTPASSAGTPAPPSGAAPAPAPAPAARTNRRDGDACGALGDTAIGSASAGAVGAGAGAAASGLPLKAAAPAFSRFEGDSIRSSDDDAL